MKRGRFLLVGAALGLGLLVGCGGHHLGNGLAEKMRGSVIAKCAGHTRVAACTDLRVRAVCRYRSSDSPQPGVKWELYRCTLAVSNAATRRKTQTTLHTGYVMPSEKDPLVSAYFVPSLDEPIGGQRH